MRLLTTAFLFTSLLVCVAGCVNEDPVPAYVSVAYQVRCLGTCFNAADNPPRSLYYVDGEDDLSVKCAMSTKSGQNVLGFSTYCPGGNSACGQDRLRFEISGLQIENKDGSPGDTCKVTVREGANEYTSPCTNDGIKGDNRCQLQYKVTKENSLVTGSMICKEISNTNSPDITRYIVAPGSTKAVKFTVQGCEGL